jgi:hypothetical protein
MKVQLPESEPKGSLVPAGQNPEIADLALDLLMSSGSSVLPQQASVKQGHPQQAPVKQGHPALSGVVALALVSSRDSILLAPAPVVLKLALSMG